jgi:hypothetical protein
MRKAESAKNQDSYVLLRTVSKETLLMSGSCPQVVAIPLLVSRKDGGREIPSLKLASYGYMLNLQFVFQFPHFFFYAEDILISKVMVGDA